MQTSLNELTLVGLNQYSGHVLSNRFYPCPNQYLTTEVCIVWKVHIKYIFLLVDKITGGLLYDQKNIYLNVNNWRRRIEILDLQWLIYQSVYTKQILYSN